MEMHVFGQVLRNLRISAQRVVQKLYQRHSRVLQPGLHTPAEFQKFWYVRSTEPARPVCLEKCLKYGNAKKHVNFEDAFHWNREYLACTNVIVACTML